MTRITRLLILPLVLVAASHFAHAGAGWTASGRIAELQSNEFGRILLRVEVGSNPSGCRDGAWFYREGSNATQQMLDVLLTALRAQRPVSLYVTGLCHLKGYSEISAVSISP